MSKLNRKLNYSLRAIVAFIAISALLASSLFAQIVEPSQGRNKSAGSNKSAAPSGRLALATPESVGMSSGRLAQIDAAVLKAIEARQTPGAIVLVARKGRIVYRKAFGERALQPAREL